MFMDLPLPGEGGPNNLRGHEEINCRVCIESKQESLVINSHPQSATVSADTHTTSAVSTETHTFGAKIPICALPDNPAH